MQRLLRALFLAAVALLVHPALPAQVETRPSFVMIVVDDLAWREVAFLPRLRAWMAQGTTFDRFYAPTSLCCPSHASILRGQYAHNTGVWRNTPANDGAWPAFQKHEQDTLATQLHAAGYRTGLIGKYLNGWPKHNPPPPGWDTWVDGRTGRPVADRLADDAEQFIGDTNRPFFLYLTPNEPHEGTAVAKRYQDAPVGCVDLCATRVRQMMAVEDLLERLDQVLTRAGIRESTYVFFLSDNGYLLGEHGAQHKNRPWDASARIPLTARGPGVPASRRDDHLTANIDLMPTLLGLAGVGVPEYVDGRSLVPLLHDRPVAWRTRLLLEHQSRHGTSRALQTARELFVREHSQETLYASPADELPPIRPIPPELLARFRTELSALEACRQASCRTADLPE